AAKPAERIAHAFKTTVDSLQMVKQLANGARDRIRHICTDTIGIKAELL
ncbi:hypothetical protein PSYJA_42770, partial [Pseudomonas syringae pv. japonica str. M301072]